MISVKLPAEYESASEYIRIKGSQEIEIQVKQISWKGPHLPVGEWCPVAMPDHPPSAEHLEEQLFALVHEHFLRCTSCGDWNVHGHMFDDSLCHGCASTLLGVVY